MVVDDWGVLEVVLGSSMGLPEAAETIHRLAAKWNVPHDKISFDKLGIGRNFPNHLARWGITMAIPYAGEGRPQDPSSFVNLRTEAGWKLRNRLDATHLVYATAHPGLRPWARLPSILLWALPTPIDATAALLLLLWRVLCPAGR